MAQKTKTKLPVMPFYVGDHIASTRGMTLAEKGAYFDILCFGWLNGGPLSADRMKLARQLGIPHTELDDVWEGIRDKFDTSKGLLVNHRQEVVRTETLQRKAKSSDRARQAAEKRWLNAPGIESRAPRIANDAPSTKSDAPGIVEEDRAPMLEASKSMRGAMLEQCQSESESESESESKYQSQTLREAKAPEVNAKHTSVAAHDHSAELIRSVNGKPDESDLALRMRKATQYVRAVRDVPDDTLRGMYHLSATQIRSVRAQSQTPADVVTA